MRARARKPCGWDCAGREHEGKRAHSAWARKPHELGRTLEAMAQATVSEAIIQASLSARRAANASISGGSIIPRSTRRNGTNSSP